MDSKTIYKFSIDPKLITEVGDNYCETLMRIYRVLSANDIRARICENDVIESEDISGDNNIAVCLDVVSQLYSLYPELQKAPLLFVSVDQWTPVATQLKVEYSLGGHREFKQSSTGYAKK